MKKLAIKGHPTRGREVIELLKMLGGSNTYNFSGCNDYAYYVNDGHQNIIRGSEYIFGNEDMQCFTLEEFLEKYPYKVGDTVTVWVEDWENRRGSYVSVKIECVKWDDRRCEIIYVTKVGGMYIFFEAKDVKENMEENDNPLKDNDNPTNVEDTQSKRDIDKAEFMIKHMILPNKMDDKLEYEIIDGYEFDKVENGKIILKPIKPKYPTTYKECEKILGLEDSIIEGCLGYEYKLLNDFQKLLMCRDAYWKIAGEQIGLDKPWEPDNDAEIYNIYRTKNIIRLGGACWGGNCNILEFPTEEMRDAFYENFKKEIEQCKELL